MIKKKFYSVLALTCIKKMQRYSLSFLIIIFLLLANQIQAQGAYKNLFYDGINEYVNVGDLATDGIAELSIEAWVNHFDAGDDRIVCKSTSTQVIDHTFSLGLSSNRIRVRINGNGDYDGTTSLATNKWYHVAFTYDGDSIKIYLNGVLDKDYDASLGAINASAQDVMIANVNSLQDRYFYGHIDEVRVWKTARSINELRTNMCRTIDGSNTNLLGYWRFNSNLGTTAIDESENNNGTLINMEDEDWVWSGAAIGDASDYDYDAVTPTPSLFSCTLSASEGDSFTAVGESGTFSGIHVYRTDAAAQRTGATIPASWSADQLRYWGVYAVGTAPVYTITYNYNGHSGIADESDLVLCVRNDNNDNSWQDLSAVLNETANTLVKFSENNAEYALGSKTGINSLPVELTKFSASVKNNSVLLNWETATEIDNYGFEIEKQNSELRSQTSLTGRQDSEWGKVAFVEGHGNSNSPKLYQYSDKSTSFGKYSYRLKQIDIDGAFEYSNVIEVDLGMPDKFELNQNYPNPFNPSTNISFVIPQASFVTLKVFDAIGNEVAVLANEELPAGAHNRIFDAAQLANGIYFYSLTAGEYKNVNKMLLIK